MRVLDQNGGPTRVSPIIGAVRALLRLGCGAAVVVVAGAWLWNWLAWPVESNLASAAALVALFVSSFWWYVGNAAGVVGLLAVVARVRRAGAMALGVSALVLGPWAWSLVRPMSSAGEHDLTVMSANLCSVDSRSLTRRRTGHRGRRWIRVWTCRAST